MTKKGLRFANECCVFGEVKHQKQQNPFANPEFRSNTTELLAIGDVGKTFNVFQSKYHQKLPISYKEFVYAQLKVTLQRKAIKTLQNNKDEI